MKTKKQKNTTKKLLVTISILLVSVLICGLLFILIKQKQPNISENEVATNFPTHNYDFSKLDNSQEYFTYQDNNYTSELGFDLSSHNKVTDFSKIPLDIFSFCYLRLGYRGYETGLLNIDQKYLEYIELANKTTLKTGVYFFSAATTTQEAKEEAQYVLDNIKGYRIDLPIAFDFEDIYAENNRTKDLNREELTNIALAFIETIEYAGYQAIVYANPNWLNNKYQNRLLEKADIWLANYNDQASTSHQFSIWQYTDTGKIEGILGNVDLNLRFIKKN